MIDLSIKDVRKALTSKAKRDALMKQHLVVTEKFDGTKLTLFRNELPWEEDFTKNWVVAYKGNILFREDFSGLKDDAEIRRDSIGISQYKLVLDHIKDVHARLKSLPPNAEFFVEFIQNKPTVTRDYEQKHKLFLIAGGEAQGIVNGFRLFTVSETPFRETFLDAVAPLLNLERPPVLFDAAPRCDFDEFVKRFTNFQSSLGGRAEGVVIRTLTGELYKIVADDQYDKTVRAAKKSRYALEGDEEAKYWGKMKIQADVILDKTKEDSLEKTLYQLSKQIYSFPRGGFMASNIKKSLLTYKDDLYLTTKLALEQRINFKGNKSIGLYALAGKPVHLGHWKMIESAAKENDKLVVFVSWHARDNVTGNLMMQVWREHLMALLPKNVLVSFVDSPVLEVRHFLKAHEQALSQTLRADMRFRIYSDHEDALEWSTNVLEKIGLQLMKHDRIKCIPVLRESTVNVSGTQMREWLRQGDKERFMKMLPPLTDAAKEKVWLTLKQR